MVTGPEPLGETSISDRRIAVGELGNRQRENKVLRVTEIIMHGRV